MNGYDTAVLICFVLFSVIPILAISLTIYGIYLILTKELGLKALFSVGVHGTLSFIMVESMIRFCTNQTGDNTNNTLTVFAIPLLLFLGAGAMLLPLKKEEEPDFVTYTIAILMGIGSLIYYTYKFL